MITYQSSVAILRAFGTQILNNHNWKKFQGSKSLILGMHLLRIPHLPPLSNV